MSPPTGVPGLDADVCDTLLSTTRSVRRALDLERPVPREVVEDCIRLALQAPNGANRQDWRWILICDPKRREQVAEIYRKAFHGRYGDTGAENSVLRDAGELADRLHRVPVLVLPCLQTGKPLPAGNQAGVWTSLLPAAWSYALAARSRGLGTTLTTVHLGLEAEMAELLGLPEYVHQGPLIPTAYTLRTTFGPGRRRPLKEVLHVDGWQPEPVTTAGEPDR
ncbi:nitroreductase family protein [Catenulispora rubra]|uniref:nitroreductase family protein n=1 Tax=Catenulispora rubra TaxID=280293 RepID=UPI002B272D04|nr:nitroreductase family protein [Catenulispora rubra]